MFKIVKKLRKDKEKDVNSLSLIEEDDLSFLEKEIQSFKISKTRFDMVTGENYYLGKHDILHRQRNIIGKYGELEEVHNLPNNTIVDNQYLKLVNQKNNYLLGKAFTIQCENREYTKILKKIFDRRFFKLLRYIGEDSLNYGISYMYIYYNEDGKLSFKKFNSHEVVPIWEDCERTRLKKVVRFFYEKIYQNGKEVFVQKAEVYDKDGVHFYEIKNDKLVCVKPYFKSYLTKGNEAFSFNKVPVIPFKYNSKEVPLINKVKSLQDGINIILSNFQNNMEEDIRNTILVLVNYDGENLGEFRKNLATYGAVKVQTVDGGGGDLKTLQIEVNGENYKLILHTLKNALIENAMGFDAKDDRLAGNPNQMNILSMYSDIDLDANSMESEFQASFEEVLYFVNSYIFNSGFGDYYNEEVDFIFNRDIMIRETEAIENCVKSIDILSKESIIANHPWVKDTNEEILRLEKEKQIYSDVLDRKKVEEI